jgi:hypothetical protein
MTTTTQYGIRKHHTDGLTRHLDPIVRFVEDGKLNLHGRGLSGTVPIADLADLQAKVASEAARGGVFRWEVISRTVTTRTVTEEGPIEVVAPPVTFPTTPGSVVRASRYGSVELWTLTDDGDDNPWRSVSGSYAGPEELSSAEVLFVAPVA